MHTSRIVLSSIALALTFGCTQEQANEPSTNDALGPGRVATVNGEPIRESIYRLYALNALQRDPDELTDEERQGLLDDLIGLTVLAGAARENKLLEERTIAAELELTRIQLIARAMVTRHMEQNPATEAELRAEYENNLPNLSGSQYRARHILLETEEEAIARIDELNGGADFAELAREHSTGPTGPTGGDLGWFSATSMVAPFSEAVLAMEAGEFSSVPVQTRFGWHVILLEEIRDQEPPGLEAVRAELTTAVDRQNLDDYLSTLKNAATITIEE